VRQAFRGERTGRAGAYDQDIESIMRGNHSGRGITLQMLMNPRESIGAQSC